MNSIGKAIVMRDEERRRLIEALSAEDRALVDEMIEDMERRIIAVMLSTEKIPYGVQVSFKGRECVPASSAPVASLGLTPPVNAVAHWVTLGGCMPGCPACAAGQSLPATPACTCGLFGCATCAPNPYATPAYGSPAVKGCSRYNPCKQYDCPKCFPGNILPPDMRGSKKPGGGGSKATRAANAERGYRVVSYDEYLNTVRSERPGETFLTPDLATRRARRGAKEGKETYLVLRDGQRWKLLKADGDEVVIG